MTDGGRRSVGRHWRIFVSLSSLGLWAGWFVKLDEELCIRRTGRGSVELGRSGIDDALINSMDRYKNVNWRIVLYSSGSKKWLAMFGDRDRTDR